MKPTTIAFAAGLVLALPATTASADHVGLSGISGWTPPLSGLQSFTSPPPPPSVYIPNYRPPAGAYVPPPPAQTFTSAPAQKGDGTGKLVASLIGLWVLAEVWSAMIADRGDDGG